MRFIQRWLRAIYPHLLLGANIWLLMLLFATNHWLVFAAELAVAFLSFKFIERGV